MDILVVFGVLAFGALLLWTLVKFAGEIGLFGFGIIASLTMWFIGDISVRVFDTPLMIMMPISVLLFVGLLVMNFRYSKRSAFMFIALVVVSVVSVAVFEVLSDIALRGLAMATLVSVGSQLLATCVAVVAMGWTGILIFNYFDSREINTLICYLTASFVAIALFCIANEVITLSLAGVPFAEIMQSILVQWYHRTFVIMLALPLFYYLTRPRILNDNEI